MNIIAYNPPFSFHSLFRNDPSHEPWSTLDRKFKKISPDKGQLHFDTKLHLHLRKTVPVLMESHGKNVFLALPILCLVNIYLQNSTGYKP